MTQETSAQPFMSRSRKLLLAGAVALLGLGAAGAAFGPVHAQEAESRAEIGWGGGPFGGHPLDRALRSVEASREQRAQIRTIVGEARSELRPVVWEALDRRDALAALLEAETLDRAAFETLRKETLASLDAASERALKAFLDAAEVLTPAQRAELLEGGPGFGGGRHGSWRD